VSLTAQQRLAGLPPELVPRLREIGQALQQRRIADAERLAIAALALAPRHPEVLRMFAVIQSLNGRPYEAIQALLQANSQRPNDAMIHDALGSAYVAIKDHARARAAMRRACELAPDVATCWFNYGRLLSIENDHAAARRALERVVELDPKHAAARTMLANALIGDGENAAAIDLLRRITRETPDAAGQAWRHLATLKPMPLNDQDIVAMRRVLQQGQPSTAERIALTFALGLALEHQGDYAQAFATFQAGHALARRGEPYDAAAGSRHVDGILQAFSSAPAGSEQAQGDEVIFIVSLPRSGSSLTEQIIASHSQVEGAMELQDLPQEIMDESDRMRQPFPQWVRTHTPQQWQALGQRYLERTRRWRAQRPRFTDKAPPNWQYVGAILAMLPQARVVVCRRDPLETCLACYRYMFMQCAYAHDLRDLASHWHDFDRAVQHWRALYPERVREQVYEDLVADPETQVRQLLEFCGLPFEAACLNFHETRRRVTTPSATQVREPLRRDTARSGKYGALLDPVRVALGLPPFV
jgi:tetratricopeptide (TPR) repeat protein